MNFLDQKKEQTILEPLLFPNIPYSNFQTTIIKIEQSLFF